MYNIIATRTFRSMAKDRRLPDKCWAKFHITKYKKESICDCVDHCKYTPPPALSYISIENKYQQEVMYA